MQLLCGGLVDGLGSEALAATLVTVRGARIESLEPLPRDGVPGGALDLRELTLCPGLIDCHDHLGFELADLTPQVAAGESTLTLAAARNAGAILDSGITTLRDLGCYKHLSTVWRDAIGSGLMRGPRMVVAGEWIARTGGHPRDVAREADGVDEVRRAVREQAAAGADLVKIVASGGILSRRSASIEVGFSEREICAAVEEAHFLDLRIAAHAHGGPGIATAAGCGVDSIEHATFASDRDLEQMAAAGTMMVVTYGVLERGAGDDSLPAEVRSKMQAACEAYLGTIARAHEAGVVLAVGTDMAHGRLDREVRALAEAGLSHADALRAATSVAASVVGLEETGAIVPGAIADLIALEGDPLADPAALSRVRLVIKGGVPVAGELATAAGSAVDLVA